MVKDLLTEIGPPPKAGIRAPRNSLATQPPTLVPANGAPWTSADVTLPLGAKVTLTLPVPVGPPAFLQLLAEPAAAPSAELAAPRLNSAPPEAAGSAAGFAAGFSTAAAGAAAGFSAAAGAAAVEAGVAAGVAALGASALAAGSADGAAVSAGDGAAAVAVSAGVGAAVCAGVGTSAGAVFACSGVAGDVSGVGLCMKKKATPPISTTAAIAAAISPMRPFFGGASGAVSGESDGSDEGGTDALDGSGIDEGGRESVTGASNGGGASIGAEAMGPPPRLSRSS